MLLPEQKDLFDKLEALTQFDAFYSQDFDLEDCVYRVYNYRLASYSDFLMPGALYARGVMFEVQKTEDGVRPIRLASLPMPKFFNLNENPFTMGLDLSEIDRIEVKSDGSLMSSYIHKGRLMLKSKGSLFSEQAIDAMLWLDRPENDRLRNLIKEKTEQGITVNLEWVAPWNRVVLSYREPRLIVLNTIDNSTLTWCDCSLTDSFFADFMNAPVSVSGESVEQFAMRIPEMQDDIEGFILVMKSGLRVKVKTTKYITLHHAKDSVTNPRRLFECVIDEATDDLRSLFSSDQVVLDMIADMESVVQREYNHMVHVVETFYNQNKHLDRKSYAIKGQAELTQMFFGLAMNLFVGRKNDYKTFMKDRYKEFGIRDSVVNKE